MSKVIKVENLSKAYQLGEIGTGTISRDLERYWARLRGKEDPFLKIGEVNDQSVKSESNIVWSLKDINFEIEQGDAVGIIGRNGAGKSTLLKILSRVTSPTTGSVKVKGRIASLLEVGTGFHPELSGRENIYLNGAILGMRKAEIKRRFDEIVDFAGVERYIDTPVKRYSSGMYVRLAFGVAAHLESEILIVDEVLAVGDAEFQKKCLGKMGDVSKGEGRTVLFVSHNIGAIRQLCTYGLLLNNGSIQIQGSILKVINTYFEKNHQNDSKPLIDSYRNTDIIGSPVYFKSIFILGHEDSIPRLSMDARPEIIIRLFAKECIKNAAVGISLTNSEGLSLGIAFSWDDNFYVNISEPGLYNIHVTLNTSQFVPGQYFIGAGINQSEHTVSWDVITSYPLFNIANFNNVTAYTDRPWGVNHFAGNQWSVNKVIEI